MFRVAVQRSAARRNLPSQLWLYSWGSRLRAGAFFDHSVKYSGSVPFSLEPLALWSGEARARVPADPAAVTVEVGGHAHDPDAVAVDLPAAPAP